MYISILQENSNPYTIKENNTRETRVRENNPRETMVRIFKTEDNKKSRKENDNRTRENIPHTTKQKIFIPKLPPMPDFNTYKDKRKIMVYHLYDNPKNY